MPSRGLRKLTITLTIVIVIAAYPACGFSLHRSKRADINPGIPTDKASQESFKLEVKNDPKSPNDLKLDKSGDTNKVTKNKLKFTNELKFIDSTIETMLENKNGPTDTYHAIVETTTLDFSTNQNEMPPTSASMSENTNQMIQNTSKVNSTTYENTAPHESETLSKNIDSYHSKTPSTIEVNLKVLGVSKNSTNTDNTYLYTDVIKKQYEEISTIETTSMHDQIAIDSETTENLYDQTDSLPSSTTRNINEDEMRTTESETEPNTTVTTAVINSKDRNLSTTPSQSRASDTSTFIEFTTQSLNDTSELTDVSKSASTMVELVSNDSNPNTTEPTWKKYTTIERKRIPSLDETSTSTEKPKDMVKAESIQTTLPIPSLQMLKEDLLSNAYQPSTAREPQTENLTFKTEAMPTLGSIESTQSETLGTVASKRAGFLDLSKITTVQYETSTAEQSSDLYSSYEKNVADGTQGVKKASAGFQSLNVLDDDAINEELMKEDVITNNEENLKRYEGGKLEEVQPLAHNSKTVETQSSQSITEDTLSVQPINQDRRTTLYTVGPNYKPMKRIEVQPAKPFVRDPDDNSWRNESISSLGIVFKPKNSTTKSYKEVLKNKTETEFNNLQDKDDKDETPELRVRLEKIAEVRKSKKKRIDKFGEVVYTDYEEGSSAEGSSTAPPVNSSESLSSKNLETEVTSPMTTTANQSHYWKTELEKISKEELYKDLGLDILTTKKPTKKPYNLAEYYDTTDEYDADYMTLSKMDLKKFSVQEKTTFPFPLKTTYSPLTSPPLPATFRLSPPPRFPDRQPTVQYFPPTTKRPKVNVNDYDVNFERRVKQYTLAQTPRTAPPPDPAAAPVATDRPPRPAERPASPAPPRDQNFVVHDGNFDRGTFIIKHFRDFLDVVRDDERSVDLEPYARHTEAPARGVTAGEARPTEPDYEYDADFRKDVIGRFVETFNQNGERFKAEFPVLYNSSVLHGGASSSTFVRRPAGGAACGAPCDRAVELAPAYELHYYVPEEEEKEPADRSAPYSHPFAL